ncbi:MAG: methyltransferase family protein [Candidatus Levyibacteriota bacterium]
MFILLAKLITALLILTRYFFWFITENRAKNRVTQKKDIKNIMLGASTDTLTTVFLIAQLISSPLLPLHVYKDVVQTTGFIVVLIGFSFLLAARIALAENWTSAVEAHIKKDHKLITDGVYAFVRHPIYLGYTLLCIGSEMVAGSYLFISFFVLFYHFYKQVKQEEALLLNHFGTQYEMYRKKTKMLLPFIL